jgi:hypothetical protein
MPFAERKDLIGGGPRNTRAYRKQQNSLDGCIFSSWAVDFGIRRSTY